jgi:EAL domain-containing protein (putative c-di-GMP-specific phosphodiesterase class I)
MAEPVVDLATGGVVDLVLDAATLPAGGFREALPDGLPEGLGLVVEAGDVSLEELLERLATLGLERGRVRIRLVEKRLLAGLVGGELERVRLAGWALGVVGWGPGGGTVPLLRRLDVAEVVIEPRVIAAVATRTGHAELLALTSVALAFDRHVTATGVVTAAQLAQVRLAGCTHVQGPVLAG